MSEDVEIIKRLGQKIQELRREQKLTQEGFAKRIKRTPAHLSKIERGLKTPSLELLIVIARELGVTPDRLLEAMAEKQSNEKTVILQKLEAIISVTSLEKARLILKVSRQIHASE